MTVFVARLASGMTPQQHRLGAQAGMAHVGPLVTRSGVVSGLPFAKTTGMSGSVDVGQCWIAGTSAADQGGYAFTVDAAEVVTFDPGDATRDRIDRIIAEVLDNTFDSSGSTLGRIRVVKGAYPVSGGPIAPATPVNSVSLWLQRVNAGTSVGSGGINPALVTDDRLYTAAHGAPLPVLSQADRDALPVYEPLTVYRMDIDRFETYQAGWRRWPALLPIGLSHRPRRTFTRTATFSLPDSAIRAVGTWTADTGDDGNGCGILYNAGDAFITIGADGWYRLKFSHDFATNGTGTRRAALYKNAAIDGSGNVTAGTTIAQSSASGNAGGLTTAMVEKEVFLNAGDTVWPAITQFSGVALTVGSGTSGIVHLQVRRVDE